MNAVAREAIPVPIHRTKRSCYKCGRRVPIDELNVRRTTSGGAIYTCAHCAKPRVARKAGAR
ncbi:hypothetical protein ACVCL3_15985 [Rhodanobacter sp. UC4437_H4]